MPFKDTTGPAGAGPMTGRGMGLCAGSPGNFAGGFRRGAGMGYGGGFRRGNRSGGFRRFWTKTDETNTLSEEEKFLKEELKAVQEEIKNLKDKS